MILYGLLTMLMMHCARDKFSSQWNYATLIYHSNCTKIRHISCWFIMNFHNYPPEKLILTSNSHSIEKHVAMYSVSNFLTEKLLRDLQIMPKVSMTSFDDIERVKLICILLSF